MNTPAATGRRLALLIHRLQQARDANLSKQVATIDHVFVRYCTKQRIVSALDPIASAVPQQYRSLGEEINGMVGTIRTLDENGIYLLCWEYRDERVAQLIH